MGPMGNIFIPDDVYFILNRLCKCGYSAHIVGGCVRDMLIGITPTDYDITTSATPDEVKAAFPEYKTVDTGIKHGTVSLIYRKAQYEITTYRTEGTYTDNRHPDSVSFTRTLALDLSRRDFTVNAMCADKDAHVTDLFGGMKHIEERVISAVGCPDQRFGEDALRILRALRFSAKLGFSLDAETERAVRDCSELLHNISVERIYTELIKLVGADYAYGVISRYADVILKVLPELGRIALPCRERFEKACDKVRMAALFALGAPDASAAFHSAMKRLHTDSKTAKIGSLALSAMKCPMSRRGDILRLLYRLGDECATFTAELCALVLGDDIPERVVAAKKSGLPYKISDMALGGAAFASAGFVGENIGRAMEKTLFAIMDGEIGNTESEILAYINQLDRGV